jgi:hypothetical protein
VCCLSATTEYCHSRFSSISASQFKPAARSLPIASAQPFANIGALIRQSVCDHRLCRHYRRRADHGDGRHVSRWDFASDGDQDHLREPVEPVPSFTHEDSATLTYSFTWQRTEVCAPRPPPCDGKVCLAAIDYCIATLGPSDACRCFNKASDCFKSCSPTDVWMLQAELACLRGGCTSGPNMNCTF